MYRPHEAREDTVLFPVLRTILSPKQVEALGDRMEEDEHKVLGAEGFERSVDQVAAIEKQLGIYDLRRFTPARLERSASEPVNVYANGRIIGRGEIVVVGEHFGVRITELGPAS